MEKDNAVKETSKEKDKKRVNASKKKTEKTVKAKATSKAVDTKKEKTTSKKESTKQIVKEEPTVVKKKDTGVKKESKKTPKTKNKDSKTKENILKGLGIFLMVAAVLGLAFWTSKTYGSGTTGYDFTYIDIDKYLEYLADSKARIIYVARPSCSYCQLETPILKRVASKNKLDVYYLNTETFFDQELKDYTEDGYKLINSTDIFSEGISTPNTLIVQNGKVVDGTYGYVEEDELKDLFTRNGYIDE